MNADFFHFQGLTELQQEIVPIHRAMDKGGGKVPTDFGKASWK